MSAAVLRCSALSLAFLAFFSFNSRNFSALSLLSHTQITATAMRMRTKMASAASMTGLVGSRYMGCESAAPSPRPLLCTEVLLLREEGSAVGPSEGSAEGRHEGRRVGVLLGLREGFKVAG